MNFIHFIKVILINNTRSVNCTKYNKILGKFLQLTNGIWWFRSWNDNRCWSCIIIANDITVTCQNMCSGFLIHILRHYVYTDKTNTRNQVGVIEINSNETREIA